MKSKLLYSFCLVLSCSVMQVAAAAQLLGPSPYLSSTDSPFAASSQNFAYFFLDSFESGQLIAPGVSIAGDDVQFHHGDDSVDADDGLIDGLGLGGDVWAWSQPGFSFSFNATQLGRLPTHVGVVWTDGINPIRFEAFAADGGSLGVMTVDHADGSFASTTAEDRFYGVIYFGGVSRIALTGDSGHAGIEIDHLQFGAATTVPLPPAAWLLGSSFIVLIGACRPKRAASRI